MTATARQEPQREFAFSEDDFQFLVELANQKTGIVLNENKRDMVYSRISRRLRALGLTAFSDYCTLLKTAGGEAELGHLVNAITTNLTHFFREKHHFEHLQQQVVLPLLTAGAKRLRVWSAGCSSGMEPYSIALTLQQALRHAERWDARILATDIDTNMLATGARGEYALDEYDNIPPTLREQVRCNASQGTMQMTDSLKKLIAFKHLNLLEPWPMRGPFDAIFCRNVVIYFDKPTQATLFSRMAELLEVGGWLYIGHSENLTNVSNRFELVGRTIYRKVR